MAAFQAVNNYLQRDRRIDNCVAFIKRLQIQ